MPSFVLIHPTVWPQYTNVTGRTGQTTDRQHYANRFTNGRRETAAALEHCHSSIGSRPSDHYFRSVCLSVCLFVCLFVQSFSQPSSIQFGSN